MCARGSDACFLTYLYINLILIVEHTSTAMIYEQFILDMIYIILSKARLCS